jgi:hypothetical protein
MNGVWTPEEDRMRQLSEQAISIASTAIIQRDTLRKALERIAALHTDALTHVAGYQGHLLVLDALEKWGRTLSEAPTEVDHLTEIAGRALMEQAGFDFLYRLGKITKEQRDEAVAYAAKDYRDAFQQWEKDHG